MRTAVIVDAVRTPSGRGKPGGALSGIHPADLAASVLRATLERNGLESAQIDDVLLGCVSQVGEQTMNIARQAVLAAGFDERVPATTIDRQCGVESAGGALRGAGCHGRPVRHRHRRRRRIHEPRAARGRGVGGRLAVLAGPARPLSRRARQPGRVGRADRGAVGIVARGARRVRRRVARTRRRGAGPGEVLLAGAVHRRCRGRRDGAGGNHRRGAGRAGAVLPHGRDGRALPGDRVADHAGQLLAADRRCLRRAHHERAEGARAGADAACALPRVRRRR